MHDAAEHSRLEEALAEGDVGRTAPTACFHTGACTCIVWLTAQLTAQKSGVWVLGRCHAIKHMASLRDMHNSDVFAYTGGLCLSMLQQDVSMRQPERSVA